MAGSNSEQKIEVTLPDGSTMAMPEGSTPLDVAEAIGPGLARAALAGKVDGAIIDLQTPLHEDVTLEIVTPKSDDAPDVLRHSAAHMLATAVRKVRPGAGIGGRRRTAT